MTARRRWGIGALLLCALIHWGGRLYVEHLVRDRLDSIASRYGLDVQLHDLSIGPGFDVVTTGISVQGLPGTHLKAARVEAGLDWQRLVATRNIAVEVRVIAPNFQIDARSAIDALKRRFKTVKTTSSGSLTKASLLSAVSVQIEEGRAHVDADGLLFQGRSVGPIDVRALRGKWTQGKLNLTMAMEGLVNGRSQIEVSPNPDGRLRLSWSSPAGLSLRAKARGHLVHARAHSGVLTRDSIEIRGIEMNVDSHHLKAKRAKLTRQPAQVEVFGLDMRCDLLAMAESFTGNAVDLPAPWLMNGSGSVGHISLRLHTTEATNVTLKVQKAAFKVDEKVQLTLDSADISLRRRGSPRVHVQGGSLWLDPLALGQLHPGVSLAWSRWQHIHRQGAQKRRAKTRNTSGWQRPQSDRDTRSMAQRWRDHRDRIRKGAFTARFSQPVAMLPLRVNKSWGRLSAFMARLGAFPLELRLDRFEGGFRREGDPLGLRDVHLSWLATSQAGVEMTLQGSPVLGDSSGGELEVHTKMTEGSLRSLTLRIDGAGMAQALSGVSRHVALYPDDHDLGLRVTVEADPLSGGRVKGALHVRGVGLDWDRFAPGPVNKMRWSFPFELNWGARRHPVLLGLGPLRLGGLDRDDAGYGLLALELDLGWLGRRKAHPVVQMSFTLPEQDCGVFAAAIPDALLPTVGRLSAQGRFRGWLDLLVDIERPSASEIRFALKDRNCRNLRLAKIDVASLARPFRRRVNEDGTLIRQRIGSKSGAWLPMTLMPRWVPYAMVTTEDGAFWRHHGLNDFLLNRAIRLDLHHGRFVYGGSTITQQLAKNLFFTRSKYLARKLEELLVVWLMERQLDKSRILEIYTNAVEFAPGAYGVVRGAKHYFDKPASDLSPLEAAWLGSIKPCPKCGHKAYETHQYRVGYQKRLLEILARMHRNEIITDEQFTREANATPQFAGWSSRSRSKSYSWPIPNKRKPPERRLQRR
ncbi:MAG TPA: hypothetical protein DCQ06_05470 [Myxococcales bacterium]|nr:hypothetical protein [Myxococcales bacterium]